MGIGKQEGERKDEGDRTYSEIAVGSFEEAVDYLKEETGEDESKICLVDIDGTLFPENILKLPVLCHLVSPTIPEGIKSSFCSLISNVFVDGNIAVITNRNDLERVFWNSDKVLKHVREICDVPVLTFLNRQLPGLNKRGCDKLLCKIMEYVQERESVTIYSIEDHSLVSPFRNHFLEYIAKRISNESGIEVRVVNLVIRR